MISQKLATLTGNRILKKVHLGECFLLVGLMMSYSDFSLKYGTEFNELIYSDWLPVATAKASIFPLAYRPLATEYYLGWLLCTTSGDRHTSEIKSFEVKPEGYSVSYSNGNGSQCDRWLKFLRQLAIAANIEIPEREQTRTFGGDRTEVFNHPF